MSHQISLFAQEPQSADDIDSRTGLAATFDLFADFLRSEGKSKHTIKAFLGDMRLLTEFAGSALPIGQLRTSHLAAFLEWMEHERGVPCSRKTYARRVTTLKVYCRWLGVINVLANDPAQSIRQRSGPAPLSDVLTDKQARDCIAAAGALKDPRPQFLFRFLLETGVKKAECGRLKLADIERNNEGTAILFIRHKARNVYKERRINLDADIVRLLDSYTGQYQLEDRLFNCTTRNLEYILTDIGLRAAAPFKLSFEVLRWTMALRDYRAGVEEERIREKMGLSRQSWYETGDKLRRLAKKPPPSLGTVLESEDP
jgi:integrase/recombinase XerD